MPYENMSYDNFPDEVSLRFRAHVLFVYAQSTLKFASELADEGAANLDTDTLKTFEALARELERIWIEAVKINKRVYAQI